MVLSGPDSFGLRFDHKRFQVIHTDGARTFRGRACSRVPKLYVVTAKGRIVYVGVTRQSMQSRLRLGWSADGSTGYYGYAFRRALRAARLHVWYHEDFERSKGALDVETVEAELVFLVRQRRQWPEYQTEIHFHPSTRVHRSLARRIFESCARAG
jgi:hypothetical protein